jgi:hypothetical protein
VRATFPVPAEQHAEALAFVLAEREAVRNRCLAAMRKLGPATTREIGAVLGITDSMDVNRLRSRLCGYERQAYVRKRYDGARRATVWSVIGDAT